MENKPLYQNSFVRDDGGPKFQNEAGYFRENNDISTRCDALVDFHGRDNEHSTATGLTNRHSDKTTLRCPVTENSKISGSDIIKQTHSMSTLEDTLRMPLLLFEMADRIRKIPSPRKRLFQLIVTASGLAPNTVKMVLCSTSSGSYPKEEICKRIAKALNTDIKVLFPTDRLQAGSIVNVYLRCSPKNIDYHRFVGMLSDATCASRKTVMKWLKARRIPPKYAKYAIAEVIGVSISQIFNHYEKQ